MRFSFLFILILFSCAQKDVRVLDKPMALKAEDSIKMDSYKNRAFEYDVYSQERQKYLDSALLIMPDDAFLWQQKAMPLYKARKYSLGKPFLEKAVLHNQKRYLDYSAFMKCIFSKEYEESIAEFMLMKELYGDSYVMDHTYNFYIALNYLQLNKFKDAKAFLLKSKAQQFADFPENPPEESCHFLDWFYLGIVDYELGNYEEAIKSFDMSLVVYTNFGDAMNYKARCYYKIGKNEKALEWMNLAYENRFNTINEDNVYYEIYPYQVYHRLLIRD
ncbi:tetratricopeptide repeat protein [Bizionia myxarmorum]|uniref:Tetratricopeptide repeat protein n=1 Tax=Bizionia myxarmorum TaxID=291186 RepID=A0A5D0R568_9FLAO|nr:tetratricopeptide repeat protein [Bizionia myxarmorum]TYB75808.1 tetratricopeptide repeat protein [Bizionia myxarmorum]